MATFMEPKFPISKDQRASRKAAANQTLEDVAEEILNGILCQYEPPNRSDNAQNRKPSGILRRPKERLTKSKRHSNQKGNKSARVRWMDEQKEDELKPKQQHTISSMVSPNQAGCSVAEACMDAGIEVGCVSAPPPTSRPSTYSTNDIATKRMMNAKEAIAIARAKSPRSARIDTVDIVFDDDGNPTYKDTTKKAKQKNPEISLPAVPPPPNKRERFFPELCGVRLNCGDDDAYVMPKYNFENSVNSALDRCSNNLTDDDDELIMMMDELDNSLLEDIEESDSFGSDVETLRKSINQVRDRKREQQEANNRMKKPTRTKNDKGSKKKSMREVVDHYMVKEDSDDDNSTDWEEKMSPTGSSANFLRRVWPRNQGNGSAAGNTKDNSISPEIDDNSDDGMKKSSSAITKRTASRSRSPSLFRRGESTMSKPTIVQAVYESVELVKNEEKRTMKTSIGAVLKSMTAKSPRSIKKSSSLSTASINETSTSDWDETIPIVRRDLPQHDATTAANESAPPVTILPSLSIPEQLPNTNNSYDISNIPASSNQYPVTYLPQASQQTQIAVPPADSMYPQLHPAHPLVNNGANIKRDQNDMLERQSFITAHRMGLDPANTRNGQIKANDDLMERQSFIGAYREGFNDVVDSHPSTSLSSIPESAAINSEAPRNMNNTTPPSYYPQQVSMTRDDMMERQSFITAYRQGYDPVQRPASAPLSHDDIMERMSYITASRQGLPVDPSIMYQNVGAIPSPPKQSRRERRIGRSKSPRRNRQSIESQNSFQPIPLQPGVLYDHMGNPVYGHPAAFYNPPMMLPIHRDPPTANAQMQATGQYDLYPMMGDHVTPYYAAQNYTQPMHINNVPPLNDATLNPAYQFLDHHSPVQSSGVLNDRLLDAEQHLTTIDENKSTPVKEESNIESELTWEERTRQAWERIRGGISALTFETSTDETKIDDDHVTSGEANDKDEVGQEPSQSLSDVLNQANSTSDMLHLPQPLHPTHTLVQPHDLVKRVSFGEPQQLIYYDDQDENRSTMSLPGKSSKKKKQFRGSKLVGGVLGKVKSSLNKVTFTRSMSSDTLGSQASGRSSHSHEWDGSAIQHNHTMASLPYSQQATRLQNPAHIYPSNFGNAPVPLQNSQHMSYNVDPRFLSTGPQQQQHTYPKQQHNSGSNTAAPRPNQLSYLPQQPQYSNPITTSSGYPVLSNSNMYNTVPSHYQQQQQYTIPVQFRNDRRSL